MHGHPSPARTWLRTTIERGICFCIILLVIQTWFIAGLIVPCRVSGGSMAFALLGVHRHAICPDCGFAFACDAEVLPSSPRAICPNCGSVVESIDSLPVLDGDRVLVDRSAFQFRPPRRWEIVAFRDPAEAKKIAIKRVAGLPGESVQIQDGGLYINGQIVRKTLERQCAMAVLVYDAQYAPAIEPGRQVLPLRWQAENEKSLWNRAQGRFTHPPHPGPLPADEGTDDAASTPEGDGTVGSSPLAEGEGSIDWLVYHNWRRLPNQNGEVQQCPITDIMPYNQSLPRREEDVHATSDLMLSLHLVAITGQGKLFARAIYGKDLFRAEIDPSAGARSGDPQCPRHLAGKESVCPESQGFRHRRLIV